METKKPRKKPRPRKETKELKEKGLKHCNRCEQILELSEFSKNRTSCKQCCKEMTDNWLKINPNYHKQQRIKRRKERTEYNKKWKEENKERFLSTKHAYRAKKRKEDPMYRITNSLRCRLHGAVIKGYKSKSTFELLGCSIEELKIHLESQFTEGMTWENYGSGPNRDHKNFWHVDHRKACSLFDLTDPEQQKICFHYSNLQPMWGIENMKKGAKIIKNDVDNEP